MVIGFDGSRAFITNRTGTENYSYRLLKALAKIDKKNQYIVYTKPDSVIPTNVGIQLKNLRSELDSRLRGNDNYSWSKNFQFKKIPWPRFWTQGGLAIQTFRDNLDVLFVPAHTLPVIRKPGLKTVVTVHDLGSEYLPAMHQIKQRVYLSFMQKHQLKTATKIIAVSKATKEDLVKEIEIEPDKITVVYEGYDQKLFKPIHGDILVNSLRGYGLEVGKYFLFVGTVQPRKNLERLIKAFGKWLGVLPARYPAVHPRSLTFAPATRRDASSSLSLRAEGLLAVTPRHYKLVIVGQKGWMSDEIYRLPKKLGIEDRVKFLGYVPEKDLPYFYSGAIALTFPSLFEGFGLPILEAQACGCPVLTSNVSSMPEVACQGAIFVDPYNIDDIVEGMERLQATGYRQQVIKKGFENIKRFSWEKCATQTLEVLL